jgi:hypothetical protein
MLLDEIDRFQTIPPLGQHTNVLHGLQKVAQFVTCELLVINNHG